MASTSETELARELLAACLTGEVWPEQLIDDLAGRAAKDPAAARAFFSIVVERLGDLFEPRLCDVYARLFSRAVELVEPGLRAASLVERYQRVRRVRRCTVEPTDVFVLSRITLGADVVVTSTILNAAMRSFPSANIWFVGPLKNWALFALNPRVERLALDYARGGTLADRVAVWHYLRDFFDKTGGIVIDPDSRLSQLGLLPVCPEERYFFFESRSYGGESRETLATLTARWCGETFGVEHARPFVAPLDGHGQYDVTVSFGVGENEEKRVGGRFERGLLESLAHRRVIVDKGAGGDEAECVERAISGLAHMSTWEGDYAPFASMIVHSELYAGYDSAGQHVAAAAGIPLVSVFAGYVSERMFDRWRPSGRGPVEVVKVRPGDDQEIVLDEALAAIRRLGA